MRYSRPIGLVTFIFVSANICLVYRSSLPNPVIRDSIWLAAREYRLSLIKNISHEDITSPSKFLVRLNHTILTANLTNAVSNLTASSLVSTQNGSDTVHIVKKETIRYPQFVLTEPNFISKIAKERFYKHSENGPIIGIPTGEKLIGEIVTIRRGTFSMPYNCGYRSDVSHVLQKRSIPQNHWYRSIVPLIVPDGGTFQHFLDGTLPKIIQALDYIQQPQVKLLLPIIRDKIIFEILEKLNISRGKLVLGRGLSVGADYLVFTCVTPPIHPVLWQRARTLLGVPEKLAVPQNKGNIVIITRKGSHNGGRHLLNKETLLSKLQDRYPSVNVSLFLGPIYLNDTIKLFGSTSVVIGVHGGGLYNINFCPPNTTVIEIMPTYSDGNVLAAAHKIFWMQSILLEHQYWRIAELPVKSNGDVNVNITQVENIIDKSWGIKG